VILIVVDVDASNASYPTAIAIKTTNCESRSLLFAVILIVVDVDASPKRQPPDCD
jgi:hypothetical protein